MQVETTLARGIQNSLGQKQAVGHHHGHIGLQIAERLLFFRALERDGRKDRNAEGFGGLMHR